MADTKSIPTAISQDVRSGLAALPRGGLTKLARKLGVSPALLTGIKSGRVRSSRLAERLEAVLDAEPAKWIKVGNENVDVRVAAVVHLAARLAVFASKYSEKARILQEATFSKSWRVVCDTASDLQTVDLEMLKETSLQTNLAAGHFLAGRDDRDD